MPILEGIMQNSVFMVTLLAWILSCVIKGFLVCVTKKRVDFNRFLGPGGMPSSHSTLVSALAASVAKVEGFTSPLFAVTFVLALVVMYDASGIRRAAGQQAQMINRIIEAWEEDDPLIKEIKLKELLGHTPLEVIAGAVLGILVVALMPM